MNLVIKVMRKWGSEVLSDETARRLVALRKEIGVTREWVAKRCAELGCTSLTTAAIGNIETGRPGPDGRRRRDVSVDEWLVLAAVLEVPPLALLLTLDSTEPIDVPTEGTKADVADVVAWIRGDLRLGSDREGRFRNLGGSMGGGRWMAFFEHYINAHGLAHQLVTQLREWVPGADGERRRPPEWEARYDRTINELRRDREILRHIGYGTPALPAELAWIDTAEDAGTDSETDA